MSNYHYLSTPSFLLIGASLLVLSLFSCQEDPNPNQYPTVAQWSEMEIDFMGPEASEDGEVNPFTDYRMDITFAQGEVSMRLPAFFAADGDAAETSAKSGSVWRVRFRPPSEGEWSYSGQLLKGTGVVFDQSSGEVIQEVSGNIFVTPASEGEQGRLLNDQDPNYLQWSHANTHFIKGGANSPENLLAYADFDGTYRYEAASRDGESKTTQEFLHQYVTHEADWRTGDASWQNGKGKGLIGALNYLASTGCNSIYFLTMNIQGDGKDVWPYISHEERLRFDVSKLAQWETVFDHADDSLGMMLHFVLGETENETLLDGGDLGPERQIYYRELLARFGHHRAVTWDLGEEIGANSWSENPLSNEQIATAAQWFEDNDVYKNYLVIHTHPDFGEMKKVYADLVGHPGIDGLAVQVGNPQESAEITRFWLDTTAAAGQPWKISIDEIGPWYRGLDPDERQDMNNQDSIRAHVLYGTLMSGGMGAEWYFGAFQPQQDLNTENWRAYDKAWRWTGHAVELFASIPLGELAPAPELVSGEAACLSDKTTTSYVYLPMGESSTLDLSWAKGNYTLGWFNPREGGEISLEKRLIEAPTEVAITPPSQEDWVAIIRAQ